MVAVVLFSFGSMAIECPWPEASHQPPIQDEWDGSCATARYYYRYWPVYLSTKSSICLFWTSKSLIAADCFYVICNDALLNWLIRILMSSMINDEFGIRIASLVFGRHHC